MPDRDAVISRIKTICEICEMNKWETVFNSDTIYQLLTDALSLLEGQEPKSPALMQDIEGIWSTCSMCGHKLRPLLAIKMDTYLPKFCSKCGQAVKWDG